MEHIYSKGEGEFKDELFVLFHGTGGNENSLLFLTGELNPYSGVLSFLGNVGKGESRRFFNPLVDNKLDKEDLSRRVDSFLEIWDKMEITKDKKLIFIGYSNGANFILGILQKSPDLPIGLFCFILHIWIGNLKLFHKETGLLPQPEHLT